MAAFDWVQFLTTRGIPYSTRSRKEGRGNVAIACPWCLESRNSPEDWHLGISTTGRGFSCWRNPEHRGVRPHRLVQALLNCSWQEAAQIVGDNDPGLPEIGDTGFGRMIGDLMDGPTTAPRKKREPLAFTQHIRPLLGGRGHGAQYFLDYLCTRGYRMADMPKLLYQYDLHYALAGPFRYRLVFPVRHPEGLKCWTGRSISRGETLRYLALSDDPEKAKASGLPCAEASLHDTLWQYDRIVENPADVLVVGEGPFDALRMDYLGATHGVRATCLFGKSISEAQAVLLADVGALYKRRVMLLDADAAIDGIHSVQRYSFMGFDALFLPAGIKDPAMLTQGQFDKLLNSIHKHF